MISINSQNSGTSSRNLRPLSKTHSSLPRLFCGEAPIIWWPLCSSASPGSVAMACLWLRFNPRVLKAPGLDRSSKAFSFRWFFLHCRPAPSCDASPIHDGTKVAFGQKCQGDVVSPRFPACGNPVLGRNGQKRGGGVGCPHPKQKVGGRGLFPLCKSRLCSK